MSETVKYQIISPKDEAYLSQALLLIQSFAEQGLMLEQSVEQLEVLAKKQQFAVAVNQADTVVATAGITLEYANGSLEFGGWAVEEEYQDKGVGKGTLVKLACALENSGVLRADQVIFAMANSNSRPIFEKLGADVADQSKADEAIFEPCKTCHCHKSVLKHGQKCIDTMHLLTNMFISLAKEGRSE